MKMISIEQGLDIPAKGRPKQEIRDGESVGRVALVGEDYIGLKPTMLVKVGDKVALGQPVFTDKKNPGVVFTSPGSGRVEAVIRGAKRKFLSLVIDLDGEEQVDFSRAANVPLASQSKESLQELLLETGLWTAFRTRPYGKTAQPAAVPTSLFVTALDTNPLAADPQVIISRSGDLFEKGLEVLVRAFEVPVHLCCRPGALTTDVEGVRAWGFAGPHPAGLPSTHIHFIDPVGEKRQVWHICYQDVIRIGHLFTAGKLSTEMIVALGGEGFTEPALVKTRIGASLEELCREELMSGVGYRLLSGTILDGRIADAQTGFLGRYHRQISVVHEGGGSSLFGWMAPGKERFSVTGLFTSALAGKEKRFSFLTALWGGKRAIYPLDVYDGVMPLDVIALPLLKALAVRDTEKSAALGCLEMVEEDLALCSFVCPGKNEFGPMLREVLDALEQEG